MSTGGIIGFVIWTAVSCVFIGIGIYDFRTKKQKEAGFWANVKTPAMTDVRAYNRAVGRLFIVYGIVMILLGLPLLAGQNSPAIILTIIGLLLETIVIMAVYEIGIKSKYEKK